MKDIISTTGFCITCDLYKRPNSDNTECVQDVCDYTTQFLLEDGSCETCEDGFEPNATESIPLSCTEIPPLCTPCEMCDADTTDCCDEACMPEEPEEPGFIVPNIPGSQGNEPECDLDVGGTETGV